MAVRGQAKNILLSPGSNKDLASEENYVPEYIDLRNGYLTSVGAYHKRFGYSQKNDIGVDEGIDLLIPEGGFGYSVTQSGRLFQLTSTSTQSEMTGAKLTGAHRPQWSKFVGTYNDIKSTPVLHSNIIVVCDGGPPVKIEGGATSLLTGSPSDFRWVVKLGDYMVGAGHSNTEIKWSAANNPENWTGGDSGFANVTKTGSIKRIEPLRKRLVVFKDNEIEVWFNRGGATQFVPIETIEKGIFGNGDSLVKETNALYFLGDDRRFYRLDGINPTPISSPMEDYIQSFVNPQDCYGFDCNIEHVIRWFFPTDGKTLVYDYKHSTPQRPIWWEENTWQQGQFERMPFASYMEINEKQYFGSFNLDGLVYEWSKDHLTDDGLPIRELRHFSVKPGEKRFRFNELTFLLKRGVASASVPDPSFMWRSKIDRSIDWSSWNHLDMGAVGDTNPFIKRRSLGIGRIIEFQIAQTDAVDTFLMEMSLTAKELRS